jgi:hypothetical protein
MPTGITESWSAFPVAPYRATLANLKSIPVACNRHIASEGAVYPRKAVESASSVVYVAWHGYSFKLIDRR